MKEKAYSIEEDVVIDSDNVAILPSSEARLVLDEIDHTTYKNKKMLKKLCCAVKDLKKGQKCIKECVYEGDKEILKAINCSNLKEENSHMMYSNAVEAIPTVAVAGNGCCGGHGNGGYNDGMFGGGGGLLGGLLFGALLGGRGGLFGNGAFGGGGVDGLGSANTATVAATDFGVANLLSTLNGTIASEIGNLGLAGANQTQLLSKEIGTATDTLLQQGHASSYQIQDKMNSNTLALMNGITSLGSDICGVGKSILEESCANQRVTEAVGANMVNAINGNSANIMASVNGNANEIKSQANSNFIAGMQQSNAQFMSLKDCCCETNQNIARGNFDLSNQMCSGFNNVERDVWSTSSAIQAQNAANTAALQAQACSNTADIERSIFQSTLGTERQLNAMARDAAECCCEQKLLNTMGFANIQNSLKDGFCDLKAEIARDKIEELRIANASTRDALNQKSLADAINVTLTNGFTQLGAVFTSNVIPAITAAVKSA